MEIKTTAFLNFLNSFHMSDCVKVDELILNFSDKGLEVNVDIPLEAGQIYGIIYKDMFQDYVPYGKIGLDDVLNLINIIKRIKSETINITIEGVALIITSSNKQILKQLVDPRYVTIPKEFIIPNYSSYFELKDDEFKNILKEMKSNDCEVLRLSSIKGEVTIHNVGKCELITKFENKETIKAENISSFPSTIPFVFSSTISPILELWFAHTYPLYIVMKFDEDKIKLEYLINSIQE